MVKRAALAGGSAWAVPGPSGSLPPRMRDSRARLAHVAIGCCALLGCDAGSSGASPAAAEAAAPRASAPAAAPEPTTSAPPAPPDVGAAPADAVKSATGLATKVLSTGTGKDHPGQYDNVKVQYTGWTRTGQMFDSTTTKGEPATLGVDGLIAGWTEGLQLMVVGEKRRMWIPAALAYGRRAPPGSPAGDLVIDVELLDILPGPKAPPIPEDVRAAPGSATKTASGLAYVVLTPGMGTAHPTPTSYVVVNYSGWTPDGKMFDSSVMRGKPARLNLGSVVKGWKEGVQLMTRGEKARFWVPADLAYGDKPTRSGVPAGPLVFDIELLGIQ
jgi:FKBP-type peptidyl-prolyl cis-trans isomerase